MKHRKKYKDDLNKWRIVLCLWIGKLNSEPISSPKLIIRFNAIPIKIPEDLFVNRDKIIQKHVWKG